MGTKDFFVSKRTNGPTKLRQVVGIVGLLRVALLRTAILVSHDISVCHSYQSRLSSPALNTTTGSSKYAFQLHGIEGNFYSINFHAGMAAASTNTAFSSTTVLCTLLEYSRVQAIDEFLYIRNPKCLL